MLKEQFVILDIWKKEKQIKKGNWKFRNWIQDTQRSGIYKDENLHSIVFDDIIFESYWDTIYRKD